MVPQNPSLTPATLAPMMTLALILVLSCTGFLFHTLRRRQQARVSRPAREQAHQKQTLDTLRDTATHLLDTSDLNDDERRIVEHLRDARSRPVMASAESSRNELQERGVAISSWESAAWTQLMNINKAAAMRRRETETSGPPGQSISAISVEGSSKTLN